MLAKESVTIMFLLKLTVLFWSLHGERFSKTVPLTRQKIS